ncbi:MAG: hypothetical protein JWQ50_8691 [Caballeronia mineralivorans]|jgi:transcriptional regulator GlxA family with amidase domain|nr:hypothetical protein [Caballeronia mineralivorans]MEA3101526.1 hypothetical protein [Caballeronia mineralivorans]
MPYIKTSVAEIAKQTFVSYRTLNRRFKERIGTTPLQ